MSLCLMYRVEGRIMTNDFKNHDVFLSAWVSDTKACIITVQPLDSTQRCVLFCT